MFEIHQLRYAVATAQAKSFSRAALALNEKQITLSRRVKQLEDCLGVKLFNRSTRGAEITETRAGKAVPALPGIGDDLTDERLSAPTAAAPPIAPFARPDLKVVVAHCQGPQLAMERIGGGASCVDMIG